MTPATFLVLMSVLFGASLPVIAGAMVAKNLTAPLSIIWGLLIFAFVFDLGIILPYFWGFKSAWVIQFYTPIETIAFGAAFAYWIKNESHRRILWGAIALFVIIWGMLEFSNLDQIESFTSSLESLILITAAAFILFPLSTDESYPLLDEPPFWICCGVLVYFTGNIINFALKGVLYIWQSHMVLNFIANCLFARGFLCLRSPNSGGVQLPEL